MEIAEITLAGATTGTSHRLAVLHFGTPGATPKTYIQGGIHADESPGMMAAHHLRAALEQLEREGRIKGHIVLVPAANPIGLAQFLLGDLQGRFAFTDGVNFNRMYPDVTADALAALDGKLGTDAAANSRLIREVLRNAVNNTPALRPVDHLKRALVAEAIDADLVLDLHCDSEAVMHLYCHSEQVEALKPLAALLGCKAMLTADISGDYPFDEASSRPWEEIRKAFPGLPIPDAGIATTVELRGERDVTNVFGAADCRAILDFLVLRGQVSGAAPDIPAFDCAPSPLAGAETLRAPASGLLAFAVEPGAWLAKGEHVADIIDPITGAITPAVAGTEGLLFARTSARFVAAGGRIGNIAGKTPFRSGKLLGA